MMMFANHQRQKLKQCVVTFAFFDIGIVVTRPRRGKKTLVQTMFREIFSNLRFHDLCLSAYRLTSSRCGDCWL